MRIVATRASKRDWFTVLESDIAEEHERLQRFRRSTLLSIAAIAATLLTITETLRSEPFAREAVLFSATIGFLVYLVGVDLLLMQRLVKQIDDLSPFSVASGVGPFWFAFPISVLGLWFVHQVDFGTPWHGKIVIFIWIAELVLFLLAAFMGLLIARVAVFRPIMHHFLTALPSKKRGRVTKLPAAIVVTSGFLVRSFTLFFLIDALLGTNPMLATIVLSLATSALLGIVAFGARQFEKYDVARISLMRGLRMAFLRRRVAVPGFGRYVIELQEDIGVRRRDFVAFRGSLFIEGVLRTPAQVAALYYLHLWQRRRENPENESS